MPTNGIFLSIQITILIINSKLLIVKIANNIIYAIFISITRSKISVVELINTKNEYKYLKSGVIFKNNKLNGAKNNLNIENNKSKIKLNNIYYHLTFQRIF